MRHELPPQDLEYISKIYQEVAELDDRLAKLKAAAKPASAAEHYINLNHTEADLQQVRDYLRDSILEQDTSTEHKVRLLKEYGFAIDIADDLEVYDTAMSPYQPGTPIEFRLTGEQVMQYIGTVTEPPYLEVHVDSRDTILPIAVVGIESGGEFDYESFLFEANESGRLELSGIRRLNT